MRAMWIGLTLAGCARPADVPADDVPVDTDVEDTGVPRTGCDDPALAAALASLADWPVVGACAWVQLGAAPEDRATALLIDVQIPTGAKVAGDLFTIDLVDPTEDGMVTVQQGSDLLGDLCTDVGPAVRPDIRATWTPARGTVRVRVTEGGDTFRADVELTDLVVTLGDQTCAVPDHTWPAVLLGWLAG
jgi:hypothetical protein